MSRTQRCESEVKQFLYALVNFVAASVFLKATSEVKRSTRKNTLKHKHPETEIYSRDRESRRRGGSSRRRRRRKGIKVKRDLLVVQLILIQSRWEGGRIDER